jgi:pimeloyl-ACP methyl ester carboxylesterase
MKTIQSKDGTILSYDVYGSGPALIYITGAICFRNFSPVVKDAKTFASEFTVYNYDRRGRGDSTDTKPYTVEREVEDIEAMIDAAGGKAFLYGHSSGAVLALEAALHLPNKVIKATLYDPSYTSASEKSGYSLVRQEVMALLHQKKNAQALKRFLIGIGMPKAFVFFLPLMPGWRTMKALAPTLEYDMFMTRDTPPVDRAAEVKIPMHIIYGEKSPSSIHEAAKDLAKAIPNSQLSMMTGQDHMVSAKALLPLLASFFKSAK